MSAARVELVARQLGWPVGFVRDLVAFLADGVSMTADLAEALDSTRAAVAGYSTLTDVALLVMGVTRFDDQAEARTAALMAEA